MNLHGMYLQHLHTKVKIPAMAGLMSLNISIDLCKITDGSIFYELNISEQLSLTKTVDLISTFFFSIPAHVSVSTIADILTTHYIKNGVLSGHMVSQIIKNHIEVESQAYLTS